MARADFKVDTGWQVPPSKCESLEVFLTGSSSSGVPLGIADHWGRWVGWRWVEGMVIAF